MLVLVTAVPIRALAWIALPFGLFSYVIMGHAPIYGWFLWVAPLREFFSRGGPRK